jgi:hypothetical protein
MQFTGSHSVTIDDMAHGIQLASRWRDTALSLFVVLVLAAILLQVGYSFFLYVGAAANAPNKLLELLRFDNASDIGTGLISWLSIFVTLLLPIFLFFSLRALVEALHPKLRGRRLMKDTATLGPTTYTRDEEGVRSETKGGPNTFLPWTTFDGIPHDDAMAILTRKRQLRFFVPLAAFGGDREQVLGHISSKLNGPQSPS